MSNVEKKIIKKIKIIKAKGLENLEVEFKEKGLTAILGVNGSGKSTILHLLACGYTPDRGSQNYVFPNFFIPISFPGQNSFSWQDTSFTYLYKLREEESELLVSKTRSRWMRYDKRPVRWVSYVGLSTCVPDIENEKRKSRIDFSSTENLSDSILNDAKYILGKEYTEYSICERRDKRTNIRVIVDDISYTSLSMGAGEQRIFKILEEVEKAPPYGLILIDEIDLLLHQSSLKRLLEKLSEKARRKNLQIIFTAHNQFILTLPDIEFRHIFQNRGKTYCLSGNNLEALEHLTGDVYKDIEIFVEDELAKALIKQVCSEKKCLKRVSISIFGAVENAFPLVAASGLMPQLRDKKMLFVLDGDLYNNDELRLEQLKNHLTGQSEETEQLRHTLLNKIRKFILPQGIKPEEYYLSLINELSTEEPNSSLKSSLLEEIKNQHTISISDKHELFSIPINKLGMSKQEGYAYIAELLSKSDKWQEITAEVTAWLCEQIP